MKQSMDAIAAAYSHPNSKELRETLARITPGPWTLGGFKVYSGAGHGSKCVLRMAEGGNPQDLVFAARARQDIPNLLGMLEAAAKENAELGAMAEQMAKELERARSEVDAFQRTWWRRFWRWLRREKLPQPLPDGFKPIFRETGS